MGKTRRGRTKPKRQGAPSRSVRDFGIGVIGATAGITLPRGGKCQDLPRREGVPMKDSGSLSPSSRKATRPKYSISAGSSGKSQPDGSFSKRTWACNLRSWMQTLGVVWDTGAAAATKSWNAGGLLVLRPILHARVLSLAMVAWERCAMLLIFRWESRTIARGSRLSCFSPRDVSTLRGQGVENLLKLNNFGLYVLSAVSHFKKRSNLPNDGFRQP